MATYGRKNDHERSQTCRRIHHIHSQIRRFQPHYPASTNSIRPKQRRLTVEISSMDRMRRSCQRRQTSLHLVLNGENVDSSTQRANLSTAEIVMRSLIHMVKNANTVLLTSCLAPHLNIYGTGLKGQGAVNNKMTLRTKEKRCNEHEPVI
jgi:hypothetical protein